MSDVPEKAVAEKQWMRDKKCWTCGDVGHRAAECDAPQNRKAGGESGCQERESEYCEHERDHDHDERDHDERDDGACFARQRGGRGGWRLVRWGGVPRVGQGSVSGVCGRVRGAANGALAFYIRRRGAPIDRGISALRPA